MAHEGNASMRYRALGQTGLSVSCASYGTNMLGRMPEEGRPGDPERATDRYYVRMVHAALDEGINLFDTANCYQAGRSEELLGKALGEGSFDAIVATKCGAMGRDFSAEGIVREAEESLGRLQRDCIDVLQLHNPSFDDLKTASWQDGFDRLAKAGKIRFRGVSISALDEGMWLLERGLVDVVQVNFNIFRPEAREQLLPMAAEKGVAVLTKIPLARGLLSGKYGGGTQLPEGDWHRQGLVGDAEDMFATIDGLNELARGEGISLAQLALRWTLYHDGISAAIPGAKSVEHIQDNAKAGADGPLSKDLYEALEDLVGRSAAETPGPGRAP
ncbi:MAG: aldo/keto reductase [Planctomycetota bacterium]|jgi:aryl-alcohol dehydrogenase-like predicted oxidoreductase